MRGCTCLVCENEGYIQASHFYLISELQDHILNDSSHCIARGIDQEEAEVRGLLKLSIPPFQHSLHC